MLGTMNGGTRLGYIDGDYHNTVICDTLFNQLVYDTVIDRLGDVRGSRLADFGCGTAPYFKEMLDQDPASIYGFDYSKEQLETAKKNNLSQNVFFRQADLFEPNAISAEDVGQFDKLTATLYTPHCYSHDALLNNYRNMFDCLKSNGEAFIAHCIAAAFDEEEVRITSTYYGFQDALFHDNAIQDGQKTPVKFFAPTWDEESQLQVFDQTKVSIEVTSYYWSNEAMMDALQKAGFVDVTMDENMTVSRIKFNDHPKSLDFKASLEKYSSMRFYKARKP